MGSLEGKVALVTGATAGIGFHTAMALALEGARVLVTARDEVRGREAVSQIRSAAGHDSVELVPADAASVRANIELADHVSARVEELHILVNNAGRVFPERRETAEGFEATLALNFIGPFTLTTRLLPLLSRTASSRVINVGSSAFAMWKGDPFEDLACRERYVGIDAHARAKLLNLLFTLALARRLDGTGTIAHSVNPGMAWTPGVAALTPAAVPHWRFVWPIVRWFQRRASAETAARAPVFVATSKAAGSPSGRYFDGVKEKGLPPSVRDVAHQERTWNLGEWFVSRALGSGELERREAEKSEPPDTEPGA